MLVPPRFTRKQYTKHFENYHLIVSFSENKSQVGAAFGDRNQIYKYHQALPSTHITVFLINYYSGDSQR